MQAAVAATNEIPPDTPQHTEYRTPLDVLALTATERDGRLESLLRSLLHRLSSLRDDSPEEHAACLMQVALEILSEVRGNPIAGAICGQETMLLFNSEDTFSNVADFAHMATESDGWFTGWASRFATRYRQGRGYPTPTHVMESLSAEIEDFETDLAITRRTLKNYPELFETATAATAAEANLLPRESCGHPINTSELASARQRPRGRTSLDTLPLRFGAVAQAASRW